MKSTKTTVITPIYNNLELCRDTIDSVIKNTEGEWEYLLVYNHPLDNRVLPYLQEIKDKYQEITILDKGINLGCHNAVNAGFEIATGDYIVKLDDDSVIKNHGWNLHLIKTIEYVSKNIAKCCFCAPASNVQHGSLQVAYQITNYRFNMVTGGTLGFSCVMFPQEIIKLYGPLLAQNWKDKTIGGTSLYGGEEFYYMNLARQYGHSFGYDMGVEIFHQGNEWRDPAYVAWKYGGGYLEWFSYDLVELKKDTGMLANIYKYWLTREMNEWYINTARTELIKMGYVINADVGK